MIFSIPARVGRQLSYLIDFNQPFTVQYNYVTDGQDKKSEHLPYLHSINFAQSNREKNVISENCERSPP